MPRAAIYNTETGEIVSIRDGRIEMIEVDTEEGQSYLLTDEVDFKNKHVVNGVLETLPEDIIEAKDIEKEWKRLKRRRTQALYNSDWTQVPDAPVDAAAWAVYRQQLRDLPANTTDPRNVVWPEPPS